MRTLGILALVDVDAQGAPGTENRRKVPCLTGKTYEPIFLNLRHSYLLIGSYQEYTRYILVIFKVYTKCRPVHKLLNPVAGLAPRFL